MNVRFVLQNYLPVWRNPIKKSPRILPKDFQLWRFSLQGYSSGSEDPTKERKKQKPAISQMIFYFRAKNAHTHRFALIVTDRLQGRMGPCFVSRRNRHNQTNTWTCVINQMKPLSFLLRQGFNKNCEGDNSKHCPRRGRFISFWHSSIKFLVWYFDFAKQPILQYFLCFLFCTNVNKPVAKARQWAPLFLILQLAFSPTIFSIWKWVYGLRTQYTYVLLEPRSK